MSAMKLTVIMADTQRTFIAVAHENEWLPYRRRTVQIELTPEQIKQLEPRKVGNSGGRDVFEEVERVWLEDAHVCGS